jgi:hypothetical protein
MLGRRKALVLVCSLLAFIIVLSLQYLFTRGREAEVYFVWASGNPGDRVVQVATGEVVVVPFEFKVGSKVTGMSFTLGNEPLLKKGIFLEDTVVPVQNGMASSRVIFIFEPEAGIKAGRYHLTIIARDATTGSIIREGEIPFVIDPLDLIWKCSC